MHEAILPPDGPWTGSSTTAPTRTPGPEQLGDAAESLRKLDPSVPEWVLADFEFQSTPGNRPRPHHLCADELFSGRQHCYTPDELPTMHDPFPEGYGLIGFSAQAELDCINALGWRQPGQVVCIRLEHMMHNKNVSHVKHIGADLEEALAFYGKSHPYPNKKALQQLCGENTVFTPEQVAEIIPYCAADVAVEKDLLMCLIGRIDEASLFRGRYLRAVSIIHDRGIPFDAHTYAIINENREAFRLEWIRKYDPSCEIFDAEGTARRELWESYLDRRGLLEGCKRSPKLGVASFAEEVLHDMAVAGRISRAVADMFATANLLKKFELYVGNDGRNRVRWFNPYGTKTGRNAQRGYIFTAPKWLRCHIKPGPGMAVAYLDWASMEVGAGAWLSQDQELLKAYGSGDAHMFLAKASGLAPPDASKDPSRSRYACGPSCGRDGCIQMPGCSEFARHVLLRSMFKTCDLAAMYFATWVTLVRRGLTRDQARATLRFHHEIYSVFWERITDWIATAVADGRAETLLGWSMRVDAEHSDFNPRSVGNFFVQANCAEIMHLATILAIERGLGVVAIVHDALMLEAPIEDMERQVAELKWCMDEASRTVLDGFVLGVDGWERDKWVVYPKRFIDEGGAEFWNAIKPSLARRGATGLDN